MRKILFLLFLFVAVCPLLVSAQGCVDINTGSLAQLEELDGIGPTKAQAIIDSRPYSSIDDLDRAKGIGSATLAKIKTQGLASVSCQTQTTQTQATDTTQTIITQNSTPPTTTYPSGVYINEVLPNPEGADETEEYIELYNSNNFDVSLTGWKLQDKNGTTTTYTFPTGATILAENFLILKRTETKIMLNNDEDGLDLITPDQKIIDSINFSKAPLGQSYNLIGNSWSWSTTLTPGTKNIITTPPAYAKATARSVPGKDLPMAENSDNNSNINSQNLTAGLDQAYKGSNPWPMFLVVLVFTTILGAITLIIKFRVYNK